MTLVSDNELCFVVFILNQSEEDLSNLLSGGPLSGNKYNTGFMRSISIKLMIEYFLTLDSQDYFFENMFGSPQP